MTKSKWVKRKRSCTTIWTHPDIPWQVIMDHSHNNRIEWRQISFETVEDAMIFAEDYYGK